MESAPNHAFYEPLPAAMPQLREKLHLGLQSRNQAWYPGPNVCNSTTVLGLRAALHLERIRSRYTGKERDSESGNDYFMARYYASSMGRFLSPDWSAKVAPVPYAKLDNPQTLNLYAYMVNNPLGGVDADGHLGCKGSTEGFCNPAVQENMRKGMDSFSALGAAQQQSIASVAKGAYENDHGYYSQNQSNGAYPAGVKCNEFVSDAVQKSGKARPRVPYGGLRGLLGMTRDPTAAEWANPSVGIPGWSKPMPVSAAEPGDVIAQQHGEHGGHAGIVVEGDYGGLYSVSVSSRTQVPGTLVMNSWGFQSSGNGEGPGDPAPVVRQPLADLP